MEYTKNLGLAKPSRNTDDIADVDVISENFQKIDDKAKEIDDNFIANKNSFCNALKGEKQGYKTVSIDDASPIESDVYITLRNKNLCSIGSTGDFTGTKQFIFNDTLPAGVYTISAVVNSTDTDSSVCLMLFYNGGTAVEAVFLSRSTDGERISETHTFRGAFDRVTIHASESPSLSTGDTASFTDIQIEKGEVATNYVRHIDFEKEDVWVNVITEKESYKITVKSGDNGKAVIKSQPTITLETGNAFFISAEYNRDINKVMDEIFKKIENTSGGTLQTWFKAETDIQPSATIEQIEE
jgi:hypothetical protein